MAKPALGRGLGALLGGAPAPSRAAAPTADSSERVQRVPVAKVHPCPFQPRKDFAPEALQELADSIKEQGIVQPLIVRPAGADFELIAGERRWRAAQMAGLAEVPVIVREADDRAVLELALIENLQRENLNAIEEAQGYAQLISQFQLTQEQAAAKVGRSRVVVANAVRLLKLAPALQALVRDGRISVGHAKVLLGIESAEERSWAADRILKQSLSVRQTEELVAARAPKSGAKTPPTLAGKDAHVARLQTKMQERFGTKVSVRYHQGKGSIEIKFFSDDDLERIMEVSGISSD